MRRLLLAIALLAACGPKAESNAPTAPERSRASSEPSTPHEPPTQPAQANVEERAASHDPVELPLVQLASGHISVPVRLGSRTPINMLLDTGASMTVITPQTRDAIGLKADAGVRAQAEGAGGNVASSVRVVELQDLAIGPRNYNGLLAAVLDLDHLTKKLGHPIAGVLGRNFLAMHDVEVDFARGKLVLHAFGSVRARTPDKLTDLAAIPMKEFAAGGLIRVDLTLDGRATMPAVLDLGAGATVINWHAALSVGVTRRTKGVTRVKQEILGADNQPLRAVVYRFRELSLGQVVWPAPPIQIIDLPVFASLGLADGPAMIAGIDLLEGCRLVLSYHDKVLYLSKSERGCAIDPR